MSLLLIQSITQWEPAWHGGLADRGRRKRTTSQHHSKIILGRWILLPDEFPGRSDRVLWPSISVEPCNLLEKLKTENLFLHGQSTRIVLIFTCPTRGPPYCGSNHISISSNTPPWQLGQKTLSESKPGRAYITEFVGLRVSSLQSVVFIGISASNIEKTYDPND